MLLKIQFHIFMFSERCLSIIFFFFFFVLGIELEYLKSFQVYLPAIVFQKKLNYINLNTCTFIIFPAWLPWIPETLAYFMEGHDHREGSSAIIDKEAFVSFRVDSASKGAKCKLSLLHSEWPKLHRVLAILSAVGFELTGHPIKEGWKKLQKMSIPLNGSEMVLEQPFFFFLQLCLWPNSIWIWKILVLAIPIKSWMFTLTGWIICNKEIIWYV